MRFYVGFHHPGRAYRVRRPVMISHNALRERVSDIEVGEWILDSGAFTQILKEGSFRTTPEEYAEAIVRWSRCGTLHAAVSQDFMCEPQVLESCGATVEEHQRRTVDRFCAIRDALEGKELSQPVTLLPVLQGWTAADYRRHIEMYGSVLESGVWVGVGTLCKRNQNPCDIEWILRGIKERRPDLRLHGFGIKITALQRPSIRGHLYSSDSMAWSYRARKYGRDANAPSEARQFYDRIMQKAEAPLFQHETES